MTNGNKYVSLRSGMGRVEWTRQHPKGHLCWQAAHANCLRHAAAHRHLKEHWVVCMDRARKLRKFGTWLLT